MKKNIFRNCVNICQECLLSMLLQVLGDRNCQNLPRFGKFAQFDRMFRDCCSDYLIVSPRYIYRLQTKLREGNVFRGVCLPTDGAVLGVP